MDRTRRVAFLGTGGTGKTTLAKYLAAERNLPFNDAASVRQVARDMGFSNPFDVDKALHEVYMDAVVQAAPEEAARLAMEAWKPGTRDDLSVRALFQTQLMHEKAMWEAAHGEFVTDRTPFDVLGYSLAHCPRSVTELQLSIAYTAMQRYTHVIVCPTCSYFNLDGDANRGPLDDESYFRKVELFMLGLLAEWEQFDPVRPRPVVRWLRDSTLDSRKRVVLDTTRVYRGRRRGR